MEISRSGRAACYPDLSWGRVWLFQVQEQQGGLRGPTRAWGEATGEAPKGQAVGGGADSTRGRAGAAGDLGHSAWLLPNRPAR